MRLKETSIPAEIKTSVATDLSYDWDPADTELFYMCLMTSISKYLSFMKSADKGKVALKFSDYKGNMLLAAIVSYHEKEDETMTGNWSYSFTFDPDDLKDINPILESNNTGFHTTLADVTMKLAHYKYVDTMFEDNIIQIAIKQLINCLDRNATVEDVYEIELPGYFKASVGIEDGVKVMAIEPSAKMNQLIKGDEEIEIHEQFETVASAANMFRIPKQPATLPTPVITQFKHGFFPVF